MNKTALWGAAALAAVFTLNAMPASAQAYPVYPWCAYYSGRGGGGTNCYFSNLWQCQQAVSGVGGTCGQNPFYGAPGYGGTPAYSTRRARKHRRH